MANLLKDIQRYELDPYGMSGMIHHEEGDYVKYDDVEKLIKELKEKQELELDKEYSTGYEKGLDDAYISNQQN